MQAFYRQLESGTGPVDKTVVNVDRLRQITAFDHAVNGGFGAVKQSAGGFYTYDGIHFVSPLLVDYLTQVAENGQYALVRILQV